MTNAPVRASRSPWVTILVLAIVVGAVVGWLCARVVFVGSAVALIPWALLGMLFGYFSPGWRFAVIVGAIYGFALADSFLIAGYEGTAPLTSVILLFAALGLVGAVGGIVSALAGQGIYQLVRRRRRR